MFTPTPVENSDELIFQMIKQLEGSVLGNMAYQDDFGIPTIGFGYAFITAATNSEGQRV